MTLFQWPGIFDSQENLEPKNQGDIVTSESHIQTSLEGDAASGASEVVKELESWSHRSAFAHCLEPVPEVDSPAVNPANRRESRMPLPLVM
eukprot:symbB.v1.2.029980.t2/scaffold3334.1/size71796/2